MDIDQFRALVNKLCNGQTPRVWSLLVSVFGELGQDHASQISGALLNNLTDLMGIKPEATRVALHRLRKEGWIESEKQGRKSNYFLSALGRQESAKASPLIYNAAEPADTAWLALFDANTPPAAADFTGVWLTSLILLTPNQPTDPTAFVTEIAQSSPIPGWVSAKMNDLATTRYTEDLAQNLADLETALDQGQRLSPLQIAALRILIIHSWRRVVLKTPNLATRFFPTDWKGADCKLAVNRLLGRLSSQTLRHLEEVVVEQTKQPKIKA